MASQLTSTAVKVSSADRPNIHTLSPSSPNASWMLTPLPNQSNSWTAYCPARRESIQYAHQKPRGQRQRDRRGHKRGLPRRDFAAAGEQPNHGCADHGRKIVTSSRLDMLKNERVKR